MSLFRKKPVVIEAEQWLGWEQHADGDLGVDVNNDDPATGIIQTLEGQHIVTMNDWIITGVEGERYPCKPGIFAKTYEAVDPPTRALRREGMEFVCEVPAGCICPPWQPKRVKRCLT